MRRVEVLHVRGGNRWAKPPSGASQLHLVESAAKIDEIFPCRVLPLLHMRPLVVAGLDNVVHAAQGQVKWSKYIKVTTVGGVLRPDL